MAVRSSRRCRGVRISAPGTEVRCRASVPTMTFSSAVISPHSRMFWKVRAMPSRVIWWRLRRPIGSPSNTTVPEVGRYTPVMALKQVVLPAPLGPIRPRISPRRMAKFTESSAVSPPKRHREVGCLQERLALGDVHVASQRRHLLVDHGFGHEAALLRPAPRQQPAR